MKTTPLLGGKIVKDSTSQLLRIAITVGCLISAFICWMNLQKCRYRIICSVYADENMTNESVIDQYQECIKRIDPNIPLCTSIDYDIQIAFGIFMVIGFFPCLAVRRLNDSLEKLSNTVYTFTSQCENATHTVKALGVGSDYDPIIKHIETCLQIFKNGLNKARNDGVNENSFDGHRNRAIRECQWLQRELSKLIIAVTSIPITTPRVETLTNELRQMLNDVTALMTKLYSQKNENLC